MVRCTGARTSTAREIDFAIVDEDITHTVEIEQDTCAPIKTHFALRIAVSRSGEDWCKWARCVPKKCPSLEARLVGTG